MSEPLTLNAIEQLGRALFAQLSSMTGARGTGTVSVTAKAGAPNKVLKANTYLLPVVGGQLREDLVFKVAPNPATLEPNGTGGDWTVAHGSVAPVAIKSNVGGARHNLAAGTVFRFDPIHTDFAETATLTANITNGADTSQLLKRVAFFEDLDSANPAKDIFSAKLGDYPAAMLVWQDSEPAEGLTAGLRQGSTRGARKVRFTRESFVLYVIVGRLSGDEKRRQEGLVVMQAITRLLSDRQRNIDGEQLSSIGAGVEVNQRTRLRRGEKHYIYAMRLRVNQVLEPIDERTFNAWITTTFAGTLPGRESPEPTADLQVVDVTEAMP
jgi:hypothetical protein